MTSSGLTSPRARSDSVATTSSSYRVRSQSISSERPSTGYGAMLTPPTMVEPQPVYIAASAASQIVTNDHDSHSETWFDQHGIEPSGETAMVNPAALLLVNSFLDQLLFNFLAVSKSTSLASLRTAVGEVLKPKLAKEAVQLADQELGEYLGGGEEEELISFHNGIEPSGDWDLELVWKRTRLRCMVYSSLGDMEEEDEDHYTELGGLDGPAGSTNRYSNALGVVSPAVAIFMTSILEFMGEQALIVAGQTAYHRMRSRQQKNEREGRSAPRNVADRVVVEDSDMERVALDRTLGRLWRGWKKRIRSPNLSFSNGAQRSFSRDSYRSRASRRESIGNEKLAPEVYEMYQDPSMDDLYAAEIPLPMGDDDIREIDNAMDDLYAAKISLPKGDDDIREIEVPGVAEHSDDEGGNGHEEQVKQPRRKSMMIFKSNTKGLPTPNPSQPASPALLSSNSRKRSYSVPSLSTSGFASPLKKQKSTDAEPAIEASDDSKTASHSRNASRSSGNPGVLAEIASAATAIGAAAVAGIAAVAKGGTPQTTPATEDDVDLEEESFEEPQIMTSSRISIGDALALDTNLPPSSNSSVRSPSVGSKRSGSVQSIRLIDVASPRSPVSRSGSEDFSTRPAMAKNISGGISAPASPDGNSPRVSSSLPRTTTASPTTRNPSPLIKQVRKNSGSSLSEVSQAEDLDSSSVPDRSPLRETSKPGDASKDVLSVDEAQFAVPATDSHDPEFVLATAPPPRSSSREIKATLTAPGQVPTTPARLSQMQTPNMVSSAPPLTPLREMMESAPDTSDEASIAPSQSDASTFPSHMSMGSMSTMGRNEPPRSRTAASDRSIPKSSPPRLLTQRDDDATPRAEPQNKGARTNRASCSSGSSIKSHKLRLVRTSEDSTPSSGENKGQSFEQLIRSETTLQYTLTPQSMRSMNIPDSPSFSKNANSRPRTGSSNSTSKASGFYSNANPELPRPLPSPSMSRRVSKSGSRVRSDAPIARDARVDNESIGDFAEFIRSTGPPNDPDDFRTKPQSIANSQRDMNANQRRANTSASRASAVSTPSITTKRSTPSITTKRSAPSIATKRSASSVGRVRLQARDAVVHGDASSELIDFIRQGPPHERTADNPRIPRAVAPFRTTMDSDQMSGALGNGRLSTLTEARDSQATTISMDPSLNSISTANSGTALLNNQKKAAKPPPPQMSNAFEEEDMMPKRKTHRVKDPYAIDYSDDEDELELPVAKPKRQEESLIDFLNSVPPPPTVITSVFDDFSQSSPPKKSNSIMSRFSRGAATSSAPHSPNPSISKANSISGSSRINTSSPQPVLTPQYSYEATISAQPKRPSPSSRASSNYASQVGDQRKPGSRVVQKSYQPREAVQVRATRTGDLADFLMNEPPPTMTFTPPPPAKEESGLSRMFGWKKKATAV